jgi:dipeptidyl-peptidase-3
LNTRLFKLSENEFELRISSAESDPAKTPYVKTYETPDGLKVHVTAGDFSAFMSKVVASMEKTICNVANENQKNMI